jgi:hypothetical protein
MPLGFAVHSLREVLVALRILLLTGWLLVGVGAAVAHWFGPGVERQQLDLVSLHLRAAEAAVAADDHLTAIDEYNEALKSLPAGRKEDGQKIRLEKAKAQMLAHQLPEAHSDLTGLVDELTTDPSADSKLLADARSTLANSQYYTTWLMRLEGLGRNEWEPEIEAARQSYKLLAEDAEKKGDVAAASKHKEDLEAAIRLERMELSELQGINLPKQCRGCCCKCNGRKPSQNKQKPEKNDIRSAGGAPPLDDSGH